MHSNAELQHLFGQIQRLLQSGAHEKALALVSDQPETIIQSKQVQKLSSVLMMKCCRYHAAIELLEGMLSDEPNDDDIHHKLAVAYRHINNLLVAKSHAQKALIIMPNNEKYALHLSMIQKQNGELLTAISELENFVLQFNDSDAVNAELASLLLSAFEYEKALKVVDKIATSYYSLMLKLETRIALNHYQDAMELVPQLKTLQYSATIAEILGFSDMLVQLGEIKLAQELIRPITEHSFAVVHAKVTNRLLTQSEVKQIAESVWLQQLNSEAQQIMLFAISKYYFHESDTHNAFKFCHQANAACAPINSYKSDVERYFTSLEKSVMLDDHSGRYKSSSNLPIFIIGMPRSGTTLLENMLSCHSMIASGGETPYLNLALNGKNYYANTHTERIVYLDKFDSWNDEHRKSATEFYLEHLSQFNSVESHVTDKLPHNFMNLRAIFSLFPNAKVIHVVRNPIANCMSIYKENLGEFHRYGCELEYLAEYYKKYAKLMAQWQAVSVTNNLYTLDYEQLVNEPEQTLRSVFNYIGLAYESSCLDYYKQDKAVKTLSKNQVRKPIYKQSLKPWIGVEDEIKPLLRAFTDYL